MNEPTIFQVNFPLSQTPGMFSMLSRSNSVEDVLQFKPISAPTTYAMPTDLFSEDDVLSSSPLLFHGGSEEVSDSDLENEVLRSTSSSPTEEILQQVPVPQTSIILENKKPMMEKFPIDKVSDFKHVIYNLLVDHYNNPKSVPFIEPIQIVVDAETRTGFRFPENYNPEKKLPELYAQHIRKARLDLENHDSIFIQDLYKFYLRAVLELLAKYFEKCDKYTFLDDDAPLFIPGTTLKEAEARMKTMRTRARKRKSATRETKKPARKTKREW